jgi:hypothetical protein
MARLFISADQIDRWTSEGKISLTDDVMSLPALGRSFRLRTAVHFLRVVEGADGNNLIGRVKSDEQLTELGAEHYGESVIIGEVGYECEDGFLGVPVDGGSSHSGLIHLTP